MAKTAETASTETALTALATVAAAGFAFTVVEGNPVAEDKAGTREQADALPFVGLFAQIEASALADKAPSFFVPASFFDARTKAYWEKRGDVSQYKPNTMAGVKDKMKAEFKKYQGDDATRKTLRLGFAVRTGKEGIAGITEPGVTVWVLKAKAA